MTPAVLVLDARAAELGRRIATSLGGDLHGLSGRVADADVTFTRATDHIAALFLAGRPVIGLCAAGILVRAVAPHLADKTTEPPLIAVAQDGSAVVPVLGGHRGANTLARRIALLTGGTAAITTAGEAALGLALDEPPAGWHLANPADAKAAMARLVAGGGATIEGDLPWIAAAGLPEGRDVRLTATEQALSGGPGHLVYHPQRLVLGVGAARHCPTGELAALVRETLADAGLAMGAIACVTSIDLKADERAILDLADSLDRPLRLFDAATLEAETPRLANPSDVVFAEVGCHGVAEAAALAAAGPDAELLVAKRKSRNATVAIARAPGAVDPSSVGRAPGHLLVIGIGPGGAAWRTPEASRMLAMADEVIGYGLYLDLVRDVVPAERMTAFPLGQETERCAHALERAATGRTVALVSSGDAGIYAMAALVEELLADAKVSAPARRVQVTVTPGISALQMAAARAGAPLGHDFCAISLSDLLTPWPVIEQRLHAAAAGDFVVAFYNPVSLRRRTQLKAAREVLLRHRPAETPVVLGRHLGRADEAMEYTTLGALDPEQVDMLTVVLVGASTSRTHDLAGRTRMFTPRGYAVKHERETGT